MLLAKYFCRGISSVLSHCWLVGWSAGSSSRCSVHISALTSAIVLFILEHISYYLHCDVEVENPFKGVSIFFDDDDDESMSYVRPLLQFVTSVLMVCSGEQFSFRITTE